MSSPTRSLPAVPQRSWRTMAGLCLVLLAVVASACSSGSDGGEDDATTGTSGEAVESPGADRSTTSDTTAPPPQPAVANDWVASDLPPPASDIESCDDILLYETFDFNEGLEIVAIDASDGSLLHRTPTDRGYIFRGQQGHVAVLCEQGLMFSLDQEGRIVASDIRSGAERWTSTASVSRLAACGASICGSRKDEQREWRFSLDDGAVESVIVLDDTRVLATGDNDFRLFPVNDRLETGPSALVAYVGHEKVWTMPIEEITTFTGHTFSPSTGWWTLESGDDLVNVQYLGPTIDEQAPAAEQVTAGGVVFAYRQDTGEVLWARDNLMGCAYPQPVFCHFVGYTDGTTDIDKLIRLDPATGEVLWELAETRWPNISREGPLLEVAFFRDGEQYEQFYIDDETGETLAGAPAAAYEICSTYDGYEPDADYLYSYYSFAAAETMTWGHTELFFPCRDDGSPVEDPDVLVSEPERLDEAAHVSPNGWRILFDGQTMRGVLPTER